MFGTTRPPIPTKGEDLRLIFSTLLGDVAAAVQAFGDLALAEGTDHVDDTEDALKVALDTLREARDRIDDLQLIDAGTDGGWELSEPVRQTVERVLRDLDLSGRSRRKVVPTVSPKVDPLEMHQVGAPPAALRGPPARHRQGGYRAGARLIVGRSRRTRPGRTGCRSGGPPPGGPPARRAATPQWRPGGCGSPGTRAAAHGRARRLADPPDPYLLTSRAAFSRFRPPARVRGRSARISR